MPEGRKLMNWIVTVGATRSLSPLLTSLPTFVAGDLFDLSIFKASQNSKVLFLRSSFTISVVTQAPHHVPLLDSVTFLFPLE